jgi:hypothetical protein
MRAYFSFESRFTDGRARGIFMSDFPQTRHEMVKMFYVFDGAAKCRGCSADIEWWTTTTRRKIPMNPMPKYYSPAIAHFSTCPKADEFRKASAQRKGSQLEPVGDIAARTPIGRMTADPRGPDAGKEREQTPLERDLREIRRRSNARLVLLIREEGTCFFYRLGIPAEDLRSDIITAANQVRNSVMRNSTQEVQKP